MTTPSGIRIGSTVRYKHGDSLSLYVVVAGDAEGFDLKPSPYGSAVSFRRSVKPARLVVVP